MTKVDAPALLVPIFLWPPRSAYVRKLQPSNGMLPSRGDVKMVEMIAEELPPEFREAQAV